MLQGKRKEVWNLISEEDEIFKQQINALDAASKTILKLNFEGLFVDNSQIGRLNYRTKKLLREFRSALNLPTQ